MKKSVFLLVLLFPLVTEAKDILFNRLEKLHQKDEKKCLEVAMRYMKIFPENAAPHYFASVIYKDRSEKSRTIQGEYRNDKKAIGYAQTFEKRDDGTISIEVGWDDYKAELAREASDVVIKLREANEIKYSEALMTQLEKFDDDVNIVLVSIPIIPTENVLAEDVVLNNEASKTPVFYDATSTQEFFGLPIGNEYVRSSNPAGEQELLELINKERKNLGMEALVWDEDLARASRYHAYDLATQDYFDHSTYDRKNGELVKTGGTFDRIKKFYNKSFVNSENIAAGNSSAENTYEQWYNSKGHYDNMFNPNSRKVGLGVFYREDSEYGYYWTFCTAL